MYSEIYQSSGSQKSKSNNSLVISSSATIAIAFTTAISASQVIPMQVDALKPADSTRINKVKKGKTAFSAISTVKANKDKEINKTKVILMNDLSKKNKILKTGVNIAFLGCVALAATAFLGRLPSYFVIPGVLSAIGVFLSCGIQLNKVEAERKELNI